MLKTAMHNPTPRTISWSMDNAPGRPPTLYECEPDGTVLVPKPYVDSGCIARLAPGLVEAEVEVTMEATTVVTVKDVKVTPVVPPSPTPSPPAPKPKAKAKAKAKKPTKADKAKAAAVKAAE